MPSASSVPATPEDWKGAPIVATPTLSGICIAAASDAVPPRLCPTSNAGAWWRARSASAAATMSATSRAKVVSSNSPSLSPSPVKSNRSVAIPCSASAVLMYRAARLSLEHEKQWANIAHATGATAGMWICPASVWPPAPGNSNRSASVIGPPSEAHFTILGALRYSAASR